MSYQQQIFVTTKGHGDMHDLTEQVTSVVNASGIQTGTVNVFNVGSTAAIGTIEFEPGLQHDLPSETTGNFSAAFAQYFTENAGLQLGIKVSAFPSSSPSDSREECIFEG